jgi:hypothetical protein
LLRKLKPFSLRKGLSNVLCAMSFLVASVASSFGAAANDSELDHWDFDATSSNAVDFFDSFDVGASVASAAEGMASYGVPSPEKYQAIITAGLGCQSWL